VIQIVGGTGEEEAGSEPKDGARLEDGLEERVVVTYSHGQSVIVIVWLFVAV
jgi:hypothetical protein